MKTTEERIEELKVKWTKEPEKRKAIESIVRDMKNGFDLRVIDVRIAMLSMSDRYPKYLPKKGDFRKPTADQLFTETVEDALM